VGMSSSLSGASSRIQSILQVLANFQTLRSPHRTREEYIAQLKADVHTVYGYSSWLTEKIFSLFSPAEVPQLFLNEREGEMVFFFFFFALFDFFSKLP
jgi:hypothetical protein